MTTTTELRGLPLLDAAIAHIEAHPETWEQGSYRCESGMCLAGWIGELAGGTWAAPATSGLAEYMLAGPGDENDLVYPCGEDAPMVPVADRAERLLGFSRFIDGWPWGERDLFASSNTLARIRRMRGEIAAREASS
jgi:hypothetical protein